MLPPIPPIKITNPSSLLRDCMTGGGGMTWIWKKKKKEKGKEGKIGRRKRGLGSWKEIDECLMDDRCVCTERSIRFERGRGT